MEDSGHGWWYPLSMVTGPLPLPKWLQPPVNSHPFFHATCVNKPLVWTIWHAFPLLYIPNKTNSFFGHNELVFSSKPVTSEASLLWHCCFPFQDSAPVPGPIPACARHDHYISSRSRIVWSCINCVNVYLLKQKCFVKFLLFIRNRKAWILAVTRGMGTIGMRSRFVLMSTNHYYYDCGIVFLLVLCICSVLVMVCNGLCVFVCSFLK